MPSVKWTAEAESDLSDIVLYIAIQDNRRDVARSIYREIKDKCRLYAENPEMGTTRPDLCRLPSDAFRSFTFKRWVIIYEARDDGIEIFAVLDGSRRYESYFIERGR